jgi:mannose-6-phosphate isomerase-like protein (cupin superfamily)
MKYRPSTEGEEIVRQDYRKKIIFSLGDFAEKGHLLQVVTIPANTRQRMHSHDKQTEVFYILEGEATITINSVDYLARPGDAFICSPGDVQKSMEQDRQRVPAGRFQDQPARRRRRQPLARVIYPGGVEDLYKRAAFCFIP